MHAIIVKTFAWICGQPLSLRGCSQCTLHLVVPHGVRHEAEDPIGCSAVVALASRWARLFTSGPRGPVQWPVWTEALALFEHKTLGAGGIVGYEHTVEISRFNMTTVCREFRIRRDWVSLVDLPWWRGQVRESLNWNEGEL